MEPTNPFSLSPNPRFFYVTPSLHAAIQKTNHVIETRQGLATIIGDIGLGKTSLLRRLVNDYEVSPRHNVVLMVNPNQTSATAFLKAICNEFDVPTRRSARETENELRAFLIKETMEGRTVVLFIDEAQQLRGPMFEVIRQLLNFETDEQKLLNIVLAGQIELRQRLSDVSKRALVRRIALSSNLDSLSLDEASAMIAFRCQEAQIINPFPPATVEVIWQWAKGIPSDIVRLCGIALQYALVNDPVNVTPQMALDAANADLISVQPAPVLRFRQKNLSTTRAAKESV